MDNIKQMTTAQIITAFENAYAGGATAKALIPYLRELDQRDPEAMQAWVKSVEDSPRKFFLKKRGMKKVVLLTSVRMP